MRAGAGALLVLALLGCGGSGSLRRQVHGESRPVPAYSGLAYEHFLRAELLHDAGDLGQAAEAYRLAIVRGGNDVVVWARYAEVLAALGDHRHAQLALAAARERDPESSTLWRVRADIALRRAAQADDPVRATAERDYAQRSLARAYVRADLGARLPLLQRLEQEGLPRAVLLRLVAATHDAGPTVPTRRASLSDARARRDPRIVESAALELLRVAPRAADELLAQAWSWLEEEPGVAYGIAAALLTEPSEERVRLAFLAATRLGRYDEARSMLRGGPVPLSGAEIAALWLELWGHSGAADDLDEAERRLQQARGSGAPLVALEASVALAHGDSEAARARLRALSPEERRAFRDTATLERLLRVRGLGALAGEVSGRGEAGSRAITRVIVRAD